MASLRTKAEEAVSQKVETSDQGNPGQAAPREARAGNRRSPRRRAEARLTEMERRLAEERETWVSTLKNQLGQRDQVTQEMEGHFAARLKDLEYRWAQEKAALENALRDRETDGTRLRQEAALKAEAGERFLGRPRPVHRHRAGQI